MTLAAESVDIRRELIVNICIFYMQSDRYLDLRQHVTVQEPEYFTLIFQ